MRLTLQEMVYGAIAEATAREKLAQVEEEEEESAAEEKKEEKKEPPKGASAKNGNTNGDGEGETKESGYKCASASSELVEKVASATEYILRNMEHIDWMKIAQEPLVGAGIGDTALDTNVDNPTGGTQSYETGQATPQSQPPINPPADDVGNKDGQTNPQTALQTDMKHVPGGTGMQPQLVQPENLKVEKQASVNRVRSIWQKVKLAADAENPAQISGGKEPLVNPDATAAEEGVPKQPGPFEQQAALIRKTDPAALADITKQQAKAEPKRQMGEVISEPAQKKSTDPVLHQNLDATGEAGVKISSVKAAAARAYLRKIAQAEEDESASEEEKEKARALKEALAKKEQEKSSQMMPPTGGTATPPPQPVM